MPTPHIEAKSAQVAPVVLMPGDPLRAQVIAETYLENVIQFNTVRNMFGYTGTYKGKAISVMGSGMGMPSIGIYSYELFKFYDVETIVRIGSCGAYTDELDLYDVILATGAYSESSYADTQAGKALGDILYPNEDLNKALEAAAYELKIPLKKGIIHSSDVFYRENFNDFERIYQEKKAIAVEMESFALFHNANVLGKKAACLLTVSDSLVTHAATTSEERQNAFTQMMEVALSLAV
jgi:purine-nucleoside phosphorylase